MQQEVVVPELPLLHHPHLEFHSAPEIPHPDLTSSALFSGISPNDCHEILSWARPRTFVRNEMLFLQGEPLDKLVLIQTGSVKVTQTNSDGNEVILWVNGYGETVGAHVESRDQSHTTSARAMETCKALVWEYKRFQMLTTRFPQIPVNLGAILCGRIVELERRFREISTENASQRLALALLRLLDCVGKTNREGIRVALSREELGQLTGSTIFTISRILSKWAKAGMVVRRREAVVIRDAAQLAAIVSTARNQAGHQRV